jgi:hypothetical protein
LDAETFNDLSRNPKFRTHVSPSEKDKKGKRFARAGKWFCSPPGCHTAGRKSNWSERSARQYNFANHFPFAGAEQQIFPSPLPEAKTECRFDTSGPKYTFSHRQRGGSVGTRLPRGPVNKKTR